MTLEITISYNAARLSGDFQRQDATLGSSVWERIKLKALEESEECVITPSQITMPWHTVLGAVRELAARDVQRAFDFRLVPVGDAAEKIAVFVAELKVARSFRNGVHLSKSNAEITTELNACGFIKRELKCFQLRDLAHLAALSHGANFSVPGSGKTTVTFALHLLTRQVGCHFFVVAPKAAFMAWQNVVHECMDIDSLLAKEETFTLLEGNPEENNALLRSGATNFLMSYDLMVRQQQIIINHFARTPVHLVLDEAHRMKAGMDSQRGAFLLRIAPLLARRDILTGTPMPKDAHDLASQLQFLWPGAGLNLQLIQGKAPRDVLGKLYVRTTKRELGLPPVYRHFYQVDMGRGQLALYSVARNEALRQLSVSLTLNTRKIDFLSARRSVIRLLQLSTNPVLALESMTSGFPGMSTGIVDEVIAEGPSAKMQAVASHVRSLARAGQKTVVWTIFTDTIFELQRMLADLNPVVINGSVATGSADDLETREGRISQFHTNSACFVLIANPAAASEGISLHTVCHNAIYVDRSYVSTHYLQSVDRVHRLGLSPGTETNIHIYQTKTPVGMGSIDYSVNRRLAMKIRNMQVLLDDPDLHEIALDEENAMDPIDYTLDFDDLIDLVHELEGKASAEMGSGY